MSEENATFEVDLNDLNLAEEEPIEGLDLDADPDAAMAPKVQDGLHTVKLKVSERKPKPQGKQGKDGRTNYWVFVDGVVTEPGTDSDEGFCGDMLSTFVRDNGACRAAGFLVAAGVDRTQVARMSAGAMIKQVFEILQGEPLAQVETQWQSRDTDKKTFLRGQHRYAKKGNVYQVPDTNPKTGAEAFTRAEIVRYVRVG